MDVVTSSKRSEIMSLIRAKDTKPEKKIRSRLHFLGYRFRLHDKKLPGCPDIVLRKYKTVIFVHGCFWHMHEGCLHGKIPKSNQEYWKSKLQKNVERDAKNITKLKELGWKVIVIWECEVDSVDLDIFFK